MIGHGKGFNLKRSWSNEAVLGQRQCRGQQAHRFDRQTTATIQNFPQTPTGNSRNFAKIRTLQPHRLHPDWDCFDWVRWLYGVILVLVVVNENKNHIATIPLLRVRLSPQEPPHFKYRLFISGFRIGTISFMSTFPS